MVKTAGSKGAPAADRRSGVERRQREGAPPDGWERRRSVEPRKPDVVELDVSASQWGALHDDAFPAQTKDPHTGRDPK